MILECIKQHAYEKSRFLNRGAVVDEVQDLANIQMKLILKSLRDPAGFILCDDSNQIVHPNFFFWSKIKSFFHQHENLAPHTDLIRVLDAGKLG